MSEKNGFSNIETSNADSKIYNEGLDSSSLLSSDHEVVSNVVSNIEQKADGPSIVEIGDTIQCEEINFKVEKVEVQKYSELTQEDKYAIDAFLKMTQQEVPDSIGLIYLDISNTSSSTKFINLNIAMGNQVDPLFQYFDFVNPIYISNQTISNDYNFTDYFDITLDSEKQMSLILGYPLSDEFISMPLYFYPCNTLTMGIPVDISESELQELINEQMCFLLRFGEDKE